MSLIWNLKIATKIVGLLMMLGIVVVAVALYGSSTIKAENRTYGQLTQTTLPSATIVARIVRTAVSMVYNGYRAVAHDGASAEAAATVQAEATAHSQAVTMLTELKGKMPEWQDKLASLETSIGRVHELSARAIALGLQNRNDEAKVSMRQADAILDRIIPEMVAMNDAKIAEGKATAAQLVAQGDSTAMTMLAGGVLAVLVAVGGGMIVARVGITGPLNQLKGTMAELAGGNNKVEVPGTVRRDEIGEMAKTVLVFRDAAVAQAMAASAKARADADQRMVLGVLTTNLRRLSEGDLTAQIDADVAPEYLDLKTNFNDALTSLGGTIGTVTMGTEAIRTGSLEIAQASEDLARRTESNAASLEETSAALVQIEGRLKATATASQSTVARADQAMATVDSGRTTAESAMQAMSRVSGSAKGIDDVIEGLDKIAFQTRVLAMNAAVEAGRAGDAGRGFAVVADLVSALAMRAEEEAKRARDQLSITQSEIVTAVEAVGKVDMALAAITSDVGEVNRLLAGMASDNSAQSGAITEITAAVSAMDRATQQNAAMVEETSAAARNLTQKSAHCRPPPRSSSSQTAGATPRPLVRRRGSSLRRPPHLSAAPQRRPSSRWAMAMPAPNGQRSSARLPQSSRSAW